MKLFKRFTALALAGVMTLGLLTGCATTTNSYGDLLVDLGMQEINRARQNVQEEYLENNITINLKELKNDRVLKAELDAMLDSIDDRTGKVAGEEMFKLEGKLEGRTDLEGEIKLVLTEDMVSHLSNGTQTLGELDDTTNGRTYNALDFDLVNTVYFGMMITQMFNGDILEEFVPHIDSFAISYRIVNGGRMYVAIGMKVKTNQKVLAAQNQLSSVE